MGELLATLRRRDFARLWFGGLVSMSGDWMLLVALPIYVYQRTGSALATGAMFTAGLLPTVLFGSVAGVFVDRWDRKKTMVWANVLMALSILLSPPPGCWPGCEPSCRRRQRITTGAASSGRSGQPRPCSCSRARWSGARLVTWWA